MSKCAHEPAQARIITCAGCLPLSNQEKADRAVQKRRAPECCVL